MNRSISLVRAILPPVLRKKSVRASTNDRYGPSAQPFYVYMSLSDRNRP